MASKLEQALSSSLRAVLNPLLVGAILTESKELGRVLAALEWWVPDLLAEVYPEWETECLDGILPQVARKTGDGELEMLGACIIMSDHSGAAIHLRLQLAAGTDEVSWLELRLGEAGDDGMVRLRWDSPKQMHALESRVSKINWMYNVTFGDRRDEQHAVPGSSFDQV